MYQLPNPGNEIPNSLIKNEKKEETKKRIDRHDLNSQPKPIYIT